MTATTGSDMSTIDYPIKNREIHSTVGVYPNGDRKCNAVTHENILGHIHYNLSYRPGRALFVDGFCFCRGSLSWEQCKKIEKDLQENPRYPVKDSAPYQ